jgi:hypothetical protein
MEEDLPFAVAVAILQCTLIEQPPLITNFLGWHPTSQKLDSRPYFSSKASEVFSRYSEARYINDTLRDTINKAQ